MKGQIRIFFYKICTKFQINFPYFENTNSFSVFTITRNIPMFEMVVILSKIKIPYLKVNSLLLVLNEIVDSHFVPKIPTLRRLLPVRLLPVRLLPCAILELYRYDSGIEPQSENSYFAQDNSGIVPILTLRRTYERRLR